MTQNSNSSSDDISLEAQLQRLLTILQVKVKSDLTGLEFSEILWLAVQIEGGEPLQTSISVQSQDSQFSELPTEASSPPSQPTPKASASETAKEEKAAAVYPSTKNSTTETSIKVPAAPALRNTLTLAKAIRPLMRKIPSPTEKVLDETATVQRIVDDKIWLPLLKSTPQKWLELALVIEQSDSTNIWTKTIQELRELLEYHGAFRDVRVWRLEMNGTQAQLFPNISQSKQQRPRSPKEIIHPRGQRLVLLVSDCVSSSWREGSIYPLLRLWGNRGLVTIVQLFPERLWHRTALIQGIPAQLSSLNPGAFNSQLKAKIQIDDELEEGEELTDMVNVKVPVITLEAQSLTTWSHVIAGFSSHTTAGFIFAPSLIDPEIHSSKPSEERITAEERVRRFRATASKLARRLAGLMTGAPVSSLPIVNLIQQTMLPQSNQVHVAEVFMSGLLKRLPQTETEVGYILYEFYDGVQELLRQSVPKSETLLVQEKVSEFLVQHLSLSSREFEARLGASSDSTADSFAHLTAQVLQQLGKRYIAMADQLERGAKELVDIKTFFQATNPAKTLFVENREIDQKYYIDFSPVRGGQVIKKLKNTITRWSPNEPTCQLFTGYIGCGKSTELSRLKQQLETEGFHVVYLESDKHIEMADIDVGDILLKVAQKVSQSLEKLEQLNWDEPKGLKRLLQGAAKLLQTELELSAEANLPGVGKLAASSEGSFSAEVGLSGVSQVKADEKGLEFVGLGIGKITAQTKASPELRSKLREYLGPRTSGMIEAINQELLEPANQKLKQYGKNGLVVIVDNLEKVDSSPKPWGRPQPEYLFVDRGEQLTSLRCHLIYTIPLALRFSKDYETLTQRFKQDPHILPMVAVQLRDGGECEQGMALLRQLVLARAFPDLEEQERLEKVTDIFDTPETLDYLCRISGGHVRNVLRMVSDAIIEEEDIPISRRSVKNIIQIYRSQRLLAIEDQEWELLRRVAQTKKVTGDDGYQTLIRSMFVYEYQDELGPWFDINPLLKDAPELKNNRHE